MKKSFQLFSAITAGALALLALQGCSSVSRGISDDGKATEVIFPNMDNDAWLKEGTFPNLDSLRLVAPGVSKDQLYYLLGRPHFQEGLFGPREWDYIFHFRNEAGGVTTCQYKAIFDKDYRAQSFYWLPADCAKVLAVAKPAVPVAPAVIPPVAPPRKMTLNADGLFRFDGGAPSDLLPEGRRRIEALASDIRSGFKSVSSVEVTGHTDRLGSDAHNDALSLARANTVRDLLMRAGVDGQVIRARGMGKRNPVMDCPGSKKTQELIACLQPNRRVDVEVTGLQ